MNNTSTNSTSSHNPLKKQVLFPQDVLLVAQDLQDVVSPKIWANLIKKGLNILWVDPKQTAHEISKQSNRCFGIIFTDLQQMDESAAVIATKLRQDQRPSLYLVYPIHSGSLATSNTQFPICSSIEDLLFYIESYIKERTGKIGVLQLSRTLL